MNSWYTHICMNQSIDNRLNFQMFTFHNHHCNRWTWHICCRRTASEWEVHMSSVIVCSWCAQFIHKGYMDVWMWFVYNMVTKGFLSSLDTLSLAPSYNICIYAKHTHTSSSVYINICKNDDAIFCCNDVVHRVTLTLLLSLSFCLSVWLSIYLSVCIAI